jgi:3-methyl-2-oxobutanoate hydroxymethyltransferase
MSSSLKPLRTPDLAAMKRRGEPIAMLTAYDWTMARLLDRAGIDVLLVGDSLGMVVLGHETTVPVTLDAMVHHTAAVARGAERALVVADMPFLTYRIDPAETLRNAGRLVQEAGAAAVKIEGGRAVVEVTRRLSDAGIPVMSHLGLTPQSVHQLGGFRQQARTDEAAEQLIEDAIALESAGAFAVVLESIPASIASRVTRSVTIPAIGIGAGPDCDGQVLVSYDMLGLYAGAIPSFVRQYANLGETIVEAVRAYAGDVRSGQYPATEGAGHPVASSGPLVEPESW